MGGQLRGEPADYRIESRVFGARSALLAHPLSAVCSLRPRMTLFSRAIVEAIFLSGGSIGAAGAVARALGLPNRFSVARLLRRDGLPSVHRLAQWATVLSWAIAAERDSVSLCWIALHSRRHPSACYRLVRKVTFSQIASDAGKVLIQSTRTKYSDLSESSAPSAILGA